LETDDNAWTFLISADVNALYEALTMMKRVEGRHESLNKRIKSWKCTKGPFDVRGTPFEKMEVHSSLFRACAVVKEVAMQIGIGELYGFKNQSISYYYHEKIRKNVHDQMTVFTIIQFLILACA
jgi:hypothetical protein